MRLKPTGTLPIALCTILLAAAPGSAQTPITCPATLDGIADCPNAGCGSDAVDVELNKAKNKTETPNSSDIKNKTLASMRLIVQPTQWNTGQDRTTLRAPGKEGTPVQVKGFLLMVRPGSAESCNCELTRRVDTDVHLVLVDDIDDGEETSVTAELTPRVRGNGHSDWVFKNAKELEGEYIRATGWLMLDTKHIHQSHRAAGERRNKALNRSTNWEVHPVTKLEICRKSKSACNAGQGWEEF